MLENFISLVSRIYPFENGKTKIIEIFLVCRSYYGNQRNLRFINIARSHISSEWGKFRVALLLNEKYLYPIRSIYSKERYFDESTNLSR